MRIPELLAEQRIPFETLAHPPAWSAQKRAKFLRVPGRQVMKGVLLVTPTGYVLAVLPATHRLNLGKLSFQFAGRVQLGSEEQVTRIFRDCEPGAVPPFGSLYGLSSIMDETIQADDVLVLEGHTHFHAIRMSCRDYERLEHPRRMAIADALPTTSSAFQPAS